MQAIEVDAGERFRDIGLHVVADDPPPDAVVLLEHVAAGTAWVAEEAPSVAVGYALASVVDGDGHLDQVSVLGRAAGRGIGAALVAVVLAWSRAAGHPAVTLTTYRDVPWNGPWYARQGFIELPEDELGCELREGTLVRQRALGLEPPDRVAMRRPVVLIRHA